MYRQGQARQSKKKGSTAWWDRSRWHMAPKTKNGTKAAFTLNELASGKLKSVTLTRIMVGRKIDE